MMSTRKNYWIALKKLRKILNKRVPKRNGNPFIFVRIDDISNE